MTNDLRITTDIACRITQISSQRLNEHVASGRFPCMPETSRGRYRVFDGDDLISLWLFREFLDEGLRPNQAGYFACSIAAIARKNPEVDTVVMVRSIAGNTTFWTPDQLKDNHKPGGLDAYKVTTFDIKLLREVIMSRLVKEYGEIR